jgi:uncharacterized protein (TIGR03435 family)
MKQPTSCRMLFSLWFVGLIAITSHAFCQQMETSPHLIGQTSLPTPLKFDVVSVKPDKSDQQVNINDTGEGDGLSMRNMPVNWIILYAFDIQDPNLLVGSPQWIKSERYDIQAKVAEGDLSAFHRLTKEQRRFMLQDILCDRFKMTFHREPKETSIYALVVAKNGSKLKKVEPGKQRTSGIEKPDGTILQGEILHSRMPGQIEGQEVPMETFAKSLSGLVGRQVVDKTNLMGVYDFKLEWQPDRDLDPDVARREPAAAPDKAGLSLFSALQEQLGLKLNSEKVMMPSLVIDHLEEPSDN